MFSTFDICLLLCVIRLAGWLKHWNLSLSLNAALGRYWPLAWLMLNDVPNVSMKPVFTSRIQSLQACTACRDTPDAVCRTAHWVF